MTGSSRTALLWASLASRCWKGRLQGGAGWVRTQPGEGSAVMEAADVGTRALKDRGCDEGSSSPLKAAGWEWWWRGGCVYKRLLVWEERTLGSTWVQLLKVRAEGTPRLPRGCRGAWGGSGGAPKGFLHKAVLRGILRDRSGWRPE